jgi:AraC-like DNA-binding protein
MSDDQSIFSFEIRPSDSPVVDSVWRSQSNRAGEFLSVAVSQWELVIMQLAGRICVTVRGPETWVKSAHCPADGEWLGITFKLGTYMPSFPTSMLVDEAIDLPDSGNRSFWLASTSWEIPTYENVETFIARMIREGLLVHDPIVAAALQHHTTDRSLRTTQRRFLHTTGLTHGAICQIERARQATTLLQQGVSIADVVDIAGYADQPHLTRSLKRLVGQTPVQLRSKSHNLQLSLLSTATETD